MLGRLLNVRAEGGGEGAVMEQAERDCFEE